MDSLDVLTQGCSIIAVRSITSTSSFYHSPIRPTSTAADGAHTPGLRGFIQNPAAFVAPWIHKDVASNIDDIETVYHESFNLVAAASHLGTSGAALVVLRGLDHTREGVLNATLVTRERFEATWPSTRARASPRGAHASSRSSASRTSPSSHRSTTLCSRLSRCSSLATYSISNKNLGPAGVLPVARGDGAPVPQGGLAWVFPMTTSGLILPGGGLPDFSRLSRRDFAEVLETWDIIVDRAVDPAAREILNIVSGTFIPWVKDLIRWAARAHHDITTRAHYALIQNSTAFAEHDVAFLSAAARNGPAFPGDRRPNPPNPQPIGGVWGDVPPTA